MTPAPDTGATRAQLREFERLCESLRDLARADSMALALGNLSGLRAQTVRRQELLPRLVVEVDRLGQLRRRLHGQVPLQDPTLGGLASRTAETILTALSLQGENERAVSKFLVEMHHKSSSAPQATAP